VRASALRVPSGITTEPEDHERRAAQIRTTISRRLNSSDASPNAATTADGAVGHRGQVAPVPLGDLGRRHPESEREDRPTPP
jgi:hypothetical protein